MKSNDMVIHTSGLVLHGQCLLDARATVPDGLWTIVTHGSEAYHSMAEDDTCDACEGSIGPSAAAIGS